MFPFHPFVWIAVGFSAIPLPAKLTVPTKEFISNHDKAIARGVAFLRQSQANDGTWPHARQPAMAPPTEETVATTALCARAILECDTNAHAGDPAVAKAAIFVRTRVKELTSTDAIAWSLIFLNRFALEKDPDIALLARKLLQGQHRSGGWGAHCPPLPGEMEYGHHTFHAMLALWAARHNGVNVDAALGASDRLWRDRQHTDGSWSVRFSVDSNNPSTPAMTCAGLLGLVFTYDFKSERNTEAVFANLAVDPSLYRRESKIDPQVRKAREYLGKHLTQPQPPGQADPFFFWTMERTCSFYGRKDLIGVDWYVWGVKALVVAQQPNGSWTGSEAGNYHATGLALHFFYVRAYADEVILEVCRFPLPPGK
jgi:hypothetical protein